MQGDDVPLLDAPQGVDGGLATLLVADRLEIYVEAAIGRLPPPALSTVLRPLWVLFDQAIPRELPKMKAHGVSRFADHLGQVDSPRGPATGQLAQQTHPQRMSDRGDRLRVSDASRGQAVRVHESHPPGPEATR